MIIEVRYIEDYLKNGPDKWKFCQDVCQKLDDSFKIKCKTSGSFLKANYDVDVDCITSGNLSLLPKIQNQTHRIDLQHERGHPEGSKSPSFSTNKNKIMVFCYQNCSDLL